MAKSQASLITILIPDRDQPEGLRIISKPTWIGKGYVFPRSIYPEVRQKRGEELQSAGVYVLWGTSEMRQIPLVYVGESDELLERLRSHYRDSKKDWTHGVVFTSKNDFLDKGLIRYLEARLLELAISANRCDLGNKAIPAVPSLAEENEAVAESYLADMRLCLSVAGVDFFQKPEKPTREERELFLSGRGIHACGYEAAEGFLVLASSQAAKNETPTISPGAQTLRKMLLEKNIYEDAGATYRLVQDYLFTSPSAAAGALLARRCSGPLQWKDANGKSLKDIREEEA